MVGSLIAIRPLWLHFKDVWYEEVQRQSVTSFYFDLQARFDELFIIVWVARRCARRPCCHWRWSRPMKMEGKEVGCCLMKQCWLQKCPRFASIDHTSPELQFVISDRSCSIYPGHCHLREALILVKKRFFVKSLHKMGPPPPVPLLWSPYLFLFVHFLTEKKRWF